jgi:hypothetical protein
MIRKQISTMIQSVIDGEVSACEVHAKLKDLKELIDNGLTEIEEAVRQEALTFNKDESYWGGKWQFRTTASTLDYTLDKEYSDLNAMASERKKLLNKAWKGSCEGQIILTQEGEEVPIMPIKKPGKEIVVFIKDK